MFKSLIAFISIPILGFFVSTAIINKFYLDASVNIKSLCAIDPAGLREAFKEDASVIIDACDYFCSGKLSVVTNSTYLYVCKSSLISANLVINICYYNFILVSYF